MHIGNLYDIVKFGKFRTNILKVSVRDHMRCNETPPDTVWLNKSAMFQVKHQPYLSIQTKIGVLVIRII